MNMDYGDYVSKAESMKMMYEICKYFCEDPDSVVKALFDKYGSFCRIMNAPLRELILIKGMDPKCADFLTLFPEMSRKYQEEAVKENTRVYSIDSVYPMIQSMLAGRFVETMVIVVLNSKGLITYSGVLCEGSFNMVPVYIKIIVKLCIENKADSVIIAHNHPGGTPVPSKGDLKTTKELQFALDNIDITLYDHVIVGGADYCSMRKAGWLEEIDRFTKKFRTEYLRAAEEDDTDLIERLNQEQKSARSTYNRK